METGEGKHGGEAGEPTQRVGVTGGNGNGAAGVDGMSISEAAVFIRQHWEAICSTLANGRYKPRPVRRAWIDKPDGSKRPLGIPTVLDRLIQQAIAQVLSPLFDPHFSESSYGFRPGRSAHDAVRQVKP